MKKNLSIISAIFAGVFWATTGIFVRILSRYGMDSVQITCVRLITSAIFMSIFLFFKDRHLFKIKLIDLPFFIAAGIISIFLTSVFYFKTISLTSVSVACVLMYTAPIFVLIFSVILFKEKITLKKIIAVLLAVVGCFLVSGALSQDSKISLSALFFGLLSGITYASYSIFGKFILKKYSPLTLTLYSFIFSAVASLLMLNFKLVGNLILENTELLLLYPLTGLCTSVIAYLLYSISLKRLEPSVAVVLSSVEPLVATLFSIFILSDPFTASIGAGIAIIIVSIIVLQ